MKNEAISFKLLKYNNPNKVQDYAKVNAITCARAHIWRKELLIKHYIQFFSEIGYQFLIIDDSI